MTDLFVEIFPIKPEAIPALFAYCLDVAEGTSQHEINRVGTRLAVVLGQMSDDLWIWSEGRIIADAAYDASVLADAIAQLKQEQPETYGAIENQTLGLELGTGAVILARRVAVMDEGIAWIAWLRHRFSPGAVRIVGCKWSDDPSRN